MGGSRLKLFGTVRDCSGLLGTARNCSRPESPPRTVEIQPSCLLFQRLSEKLFGTVRNCSYIYVANSFEQFPPFPGPYPPNAASRRAALGWGEHPWVWATANWRTLVRKLGFARCAGGRGLLPPQPPKPSAGRPAPGWRAIGATRGGWPCAGGAEAGVSGETLEAARAPIDRPRCSGRRRRERT
jgi:hypothetical protein